MKTILQYPSINPRGKQRTQIKRSTSLKTGEPPTVVLAQTSTRRKLPEIRKEKTLIFDLITSKLT